MYGNVQTRRDGIQALGVKSNAIAQKLKTGLFRYASLPQTLG